MKKIILTLICFAVVLGAGYYIGSGFTKVGTIYITDFMLSGDGTEITIKTGNFSSAGFIRKARVHQQECGKLYIDFISAFGGINGDMGAKDEFVIPLDPQTKSIGVFRASGSYEVVLEKNENSEWNYKRAE